MKSTISKTHLNINEVNTNISKNELLTNYNNLKLQVNNNEIKQNELLFQTNHSNLSLFELVNSLKEKINVYETQIRNLLKDKIRMQIEINNLLLLNNCNKDLKSKFISSTKDTKDNILVELNTHNIHEQQSILNKELNNLNNAIDKQKELIIDTKFIKVNNKCCNCETKNEELRKLHA